MVFRRKYAKASKRRMGGRKRVARRMGVRKGRRVSPIKRLIRAEISRNIENKNTQFYGQDYQLIPSSASSIATNVIQLSPGPATLPINQGVGNAARIGNRIKTKRMTFKGTLVPNQYSSVNNNFVYPLAVKLFIFYDKRTPTVAPSSWPTDMFQYNNLNQGFQNDLVDMWAPINTEYYNCVYQRQFKLGYAGFTGTGSTPENSGFYNNDFKLNAQFSVNCTKWLPKTVVYEGNTSSATSRGLWAVFVPIYANGTSMGATQVPCRLSFALDYHYEDA